MLTKGDKLFLITRRLFESDLRRHFVGEVLEVSAATVMVSGYAFVFDQTVNEFVRRDDLRTRIFSLIDAGIDIGVLPRDAYLEDIRYYLDDERRRILTDQKTFKMNVSEFGINR